MHIGSNFKSMPGSIPAPNSSSFENKKTWQTKEKKYLKKFNRVKIRAL